MKRIHFNCHLVLCLFLLFMTSACSRPETTSPVSTRSPTEVVPFPIATQTAIASTPTPQVPIATATAIATIQETVVNAHQVPIATATTIATIQETVEPTSKVTVFPHTPEVASILYDVDRALERLEQANIAYNTPDTMVVGERYTILLVLSPKKNQATVEAIVSEQTGEETSKIEEATILTSDEMEASLSGEGFVIDPKEPLTQLISSVQDTRWEWTVIPQKGGTQQLKLTLNVYIKYKDEEKIIRHEVYRNAIIVKVSFGKQVYDFASKNLGLIAFLWTAILIPVAGYAYRKIREKRKSKDDPQHQTSKPSDQDVPEKRGSMGIGVVGAI